MILPPARKMPHQIRREDGFTLIELMVTMVVLAVLASQALPSFRDFIAGQRIKTASFDLYASLVLARSEALKRNANVTVTQATGGWQNGWTVAVGATTLNQQSAYPNLSLSGPAGAVTYNGMGRLTATVSDFEISSPEVTGATHRCIRIDLSGLPNSKVGSC